MKTFRAILLVTMLCAPNLARAEGDFGSAKRLAVSPDGTRIALVSRDQKARIFDAATGQLLHTLPLEGPGFSVGLSHTGKILVTGTDSHRTESQQAGIAQLRAWSLEGTTPKPLWTARHLGPVNALVFDPQDQWCATSTLFCRMHFFDAKTGQIKQAFLEMGNGIWDLAASQDGQRLVSIGQHLSVWAPAMKPLPQVVLPFDSGITEDESRPFRKSQGAWGHAVVTHPDGKTAWAVACLSSSSGKATDLVRIELPDGNKREAVLKGLPNPICLALSPDGKTVAIGLDSPRVELYHLETQQKIRSLELGDFAPVRSLGFVDEGRKLAIAGTFGARAGIWDLASGKKDKLLLDLP